MVNYLDAAVLGLHITGAAVWVGGSVALGVVAAALRDPADPAAASRRTSVAARRLAVVIWPALALAIATGLYNLTWFIPAGVSYADFAMTPPGQWLSVKVGLVAVVVLASGVHTFLLGPRIRHAEDSGTPLDALQKSRRASMVLAILATAASVAILFVAAILGSF